MWPKRLYIRLNDFPHTCGKRIKSFTYQTEKVSKSWCEERFKSYLALEGFHRQVYNHVSFEGLFLDERFEAHVTLEWPDTGMD